MGSVTDELLGSTTSSSARTQGPGRSVTDELLSFSPVSVGGGPVKNVIIEPGGEAPRFGTQMKTGFVDQPENKIKIYAAARYPKQPEEQRLKRYGIHNGEVVYMHDDGRIYYETEGIGQKIKRFLAAEGVAKAPEWLLGALGAAYGGIPGAAAGSGAGEVVRKAVGKTVFDEDESAIQWATDIGTAGALGVAGEVGGRLAVKALNRAGRVGTGEVGRLAQQDLGRAGASRMADKAAKARAAGVDLTLPEISESPTLTGAYRTLRGTPGQAGEQIRAFEKGTREPQLHEAIDRGLERVAPEASVYDLSRGGVSAARASLASLKGQREAAAKPLYEAAFASGASADISPVLDLIDGLSAKAAGVNKTALMAARNNLTKGVGKERVAKESVEELHEAKLAIDAMLERKGTTAISNVSRRRLAQVKEELMRVVDEASPDYAAARKIFEIESVPINDFVDSLAGRVADLEGDDVAKAGKILFGVDSHPQAIKRARAMIEKQDPAAWMGLVRAHLQNQLETAIESVAEIRGANVVFGGKFRKAVFGSMRARDRLRAALEPDQYRAFSELMDVMEDTVRAVDQNSDTAFKMAGQKMMREDAGGTVPRWIRRMNILEPGSIATEIENLRYPAYSQALAEAMLRPGSYRKLAGLRTLSPGPEKTIKSLWLLSTLMGGETLSSGRLPETQIGEAEKQ